MKNRMVFKSFLLLIFLMYFSAAYAFDSGSTGALGAFNPVANTEVVLPEDGILNYTTVNIPTGVTVTFKKNTANNPVYMLATGDVTIAGTIDVSGSNASGIYPGKGGPGGFDGGLGAKTSDLSGGKGLGPGGGNPVGANQSGGAGGGGFGTNGGNGGGSVPGSGGTNYGNNKIFPMIGGSGGGGSSSICGAGGGGGSGSILIVSPTTINVTGTINASGGTAANGGGGGSGGAIKLMADTISGSGAINANPGGSGYCGVGWGGGAGSYGRIRFEATTVTRPMNPATSPNYTYGYPGIILPPNIPTLRITSVGGVNVPATPSGKYGTPDIALASTTTNPVTVVVSATNIPVNTQVSLTSVPEYGNSASGVGTLTGTDSLSTTSISINIDSTYQSILSAQAIYTVQTAMYYDGEKIDKVRIASTMGDKSSTVYITEKGREIPAEMLLARLTQ